MIYLLTRSSKYRLCFPTLEEMSAELGIHRKNLSAPIAKLEELRLISTHSAGGKRYYLIHDPRVAISHLAGTGAIDKDELFLINELAQELKQEPIEPEPPAAIPTPTATAKARKA